MCFYLSIFFILLFVKFISKRGAFLGSVLLFFLFVISAFRGPTVGDDTINYFYNNLREVGFDTGSTDSYSFEITYQFLAASIREVGLPSNTILFFLSFITFFFIYLSAKKTRVRLTELCFFFYSTLLFFLSLNIARQMAAVAIVLYALTFLMDKNKRWNLLFFPFILFASSIHISSIVCLLFYLIKFVPAFNLWNRKVIIFCSFIILFVVVMVNRNRIIDTILPYMTLWELYNRDNMMGLRASDTTLASFIVSFGRMIINVYILLWLNKTKQKEVQHIFFLAIVSSIVFTVLIGNLLRMQYYVQIIYLIVYSWFFSYERILKSPSTRVVFLIFIFISFIQLYACLRTDTYQLIPYKFFF